MDNKQIFELADELKSAKDLKKDLEAQVKDVNARIDELDKALSDAMAESELEKFTRNGSTFYLNSRLYASPRAEMKEAMFEALINHGYGDLITQTADGKRIEASLDVEVYRKIERISLSPNPYVAFRGQTVTLTPVISPADADLSGLTVSWSSDNPYVAGVYSISLSAEVTCRQVGQSTIVVRAEDGSRKRGSVHFRVEPTVPVTLRDVQAEKLPDGMRLALEIKNRMRETTVREVVLQVDDGEAVRIIYTRASIASWEARSKLTIEFAEPASAVLRLNGRPLNFPPQSEGKHKLRLQALPSAS